MWRSGRNGRSGLGPDAWGGAVGAKEEGSWAWSDRGRGVREGVSGVWPEGTSAARKEREEEPP